MSAQEHEMWDELNIDYEKAYGDNPFKKAVVQEAITLLQPGSRALDIGCGTGVPVAQMLANAGINVVGTDVSSNMISHAKRRVPGDFQTADMTTYQPTGTFDAVFIIYSQLGLSYNDFSQAAFRFAQTLNPNGLMVIGQSPADPTVPSDDPAWQESKSYVEGYNLPFFGEDFPTLMFSRKRQREFLESMGMEVLYETVDLFQPDHPKCVGEWQQYIIARRRTGQEVSPPRFGGGGS